ncbi:divalent cation transporter [Oceaniovalibus guishaninsula JLT2003]|uniref:Magnesium transporter MgtE n=1 Tax=Oceaniovalibus guishaninsula JLT2003 TaxID=1231392 RepID=K2HGX9_9RHOB|nr:magnesium transporter [Oceaniovalibus guishaninsula]EKE45712.1 divalent cation transporter [Oceaniovalibus guishaninsula JLT2003]
MSSLNGTEADFEDTAHASDLAAWLETLPRDAALERLARLPLPRRADAFGYLRIATQRDLARLLPAADLAAIVVEMDADDRADLFKALSAGERQRILPMLPPEDRDDIRRLSAHDEGTAGAIMTSDFVTLDPAMTAADAIAALRLSAADAETIYRSYVLDGDGRLVGSVRLHRLILAAEDAPVAAIMESVPVSVGPLTDQEEVARAIARYDILAIPVVETDGRLVGIVTHDDAADALQAETTEDFQRISTVLPFTQSLRDAGIGMLYSRRIVWLALLVFGNLFSGAGIAFFEETILAYVSLVFFLPLLIDSSGNAGSQSATLMVRALATGDVALRDWRALILRELAVAAALGATMAAVVAPLGAWRGGPDIALVVAATMMVVVVIGSLVGMSLPFLLSRLRLDPATASGPLVTTISDAVGVMVYFSVATAVLAP